MEAQSYKIYLNSINTFIFDVDGVLTDGTVTIMSNGEVQKKMHVKDEYAIKTAIKTGFNICVITRGSNIGIKQRLEALGVTSIYLKSFSKINAFEDYLKNNQINPETVLYMGDDIPDYDVMTRVFLPTCPQDAAQEIKSISKYVSHKKGGQGAVRDVIEQTLKVQGKWEIITKK